MILVGGPSSVKLLPEGQGPFLLVGHMTALPAISVISKNLLGDATGHAIVLIRDEADKQDLVKPAGVNVEWLVGADLGPNPNLLTDAARNMPAVDD